MIVNMRKKERKKRNTNKRERNMEKNMYYSKSQILNLETKLEIKLSIYNIKIIQIIEKSFLP